MMKPNLESNQHLRSSSEQESPLNYSEKLRKNSSIDAFEIPIKINYEESPVNCSVGETFVEQETIDTSKEGTIKTPVNRTLNIKGLGKIVGRGATNTGIEVTQVEGLYENPGFEMIVKAYHDLKLNDSSNAIEYQLNQAHLIHELGQQGIAPRYVGMAVQQAPIENTYGEKPKYYVPIMEKVGEFDLNEILEQKLSPKEEKQLEKELRRVLTEANQETTERGYDIGDFGIRVSKDQDGKFKVWILDIGFVPKELELGFDPEEHVEKSMRYHQTFN